MAKWTPKHEAPEPLEGPVVATITGGTILWFVLFLAQLPFYGWYEDHHHEWWVWTCLAGTGLGLIGIWYVRGGTRRSRKRTECRPAPPPDRHPTTRPQLLSPPAAPHHSPAPGTPSPSGV